MLRYNLLRMDENSELLLVKLYGIEKGFLDYLPRSIPAVRDVSSLIKEVFHSRSPVLISGHYCLHKQDMQAGIRLRVLKELGTKCVVCGQSHKQGMQVHHIKPYWRTWNNAFGFTVLCESCHKMIRSGIGKTEEQVRGICREITRRDSERYDPADGMEYPEPSIVKLAYTNYFYYS
jgi:hypothetical protein